MRRAVPLLVVLALGACGKKPDGADPAASALTATIATPPPPPPVFPSPLLANGAPVSFAPIVKAADPAVVTVTIVGEQIVPGWGGKTRRREAKGLGTGFIIDKDGTIITNNHVVSQEDGSVATTISVKLSDDRELPCTRRRARSAHRHRRRAHRSEGADASGPAARRLGRHRRR